MVTTGDRIRQARGRLVVGQAELARAAGLDQSGLWSIEHGRRRPRPATIRRLAEALSRLGGETVRPADLAGEPDRPVPPLPASPAAGAASASDVSS